jgi:UDP-N-acetylmuramoyl-L-alanyl-D-glutamate--2,6-diaminopimelate ligase
MKLKMILQGISEMRKIQGKESLEIKGLSCDSKVVKEGYLFIAVRGSRFNGADFINEAIDRGAKAVILESEENKSHIFKRGITFIYVENARLALAQACKVFYGDISSNMRLVGITGTNGKTTTTYLVESLFNKIGEKVGVIGTINYRFGDRLIPALNTTPGALELYSLLDSIYRKDIRNCILEVSSHSLEQGRVDTLNFDIAVFTNLTNEHLDFHKNLENYLASKMKLFTKIKEGGFAIINKDDSSSEKIIENIKKEKKANIITYGIGKGADVYAKDINISLQGLKFRLCHRDGDSIEIKSELIGQHNVYNILAASACGVSIGMVLEEIASAIEKVWFLPGRLEKVDCGQDFLVFVDYAHTENGLENVLKALRLVRPRRLLVVFGCGGDRDRSKRPKMGKISSELCDKIFITSDNPRGEEPKDIIKEIIDGISTKKDNFVVEVDRFKAIELALEEAREGDIVLVAGKGHETYQIFKDITVPFDDREVVRRILRSQKQL